ncbi:MAG: ATP-binding protein [Patescibacteria group bacterium]
MDSKNSKKCDMPNKKQKFIKRQMQDKIADHLEKEEMTIILGPRQVGKTVLLQQLKDWLIKSKNIKLENVFYFNLDILRDWEAVRDQTQFIDFIKSRSGKQKIYVFVDEAQRVENPGLFYKGIYDSQLNAKFILTGSASLYFASQVKESMAGRKRIFYLRPFSFEEYIFVKNTALARLLKNQIKISAVDQRELQKLMEDYLIWGGYPRVVLSSDPDDKKNILSDIYSSYIERDIVGFLKIPDKAKFNKLTRLLAGQIGQLVNVGELASIAEVDRRTVLRYFTALEETYIIFQLTPYYHNPRQEIIKNPKIYFLDNGLRNYLLDNFKRLSERSDNGFLFENGILQGLLTAQEEELWGLHFWRTKQGAEVDFIIEKGVKLMPIEAKLNIKTAKVSLGFRSFVKKYKPEQGLVVNLSGFQSGMQIEQTKINFVVPSELKSFLR